MILTSNQIAELQVNERPYLKEDRESLKNDAKIVLWSHAHMCAHAPSHICACIMHEHIHKHTHDKILSYDLTIFSLHL